MQLPSEQKPKSTFIFSVRDSIEKHVFEHAPAFKGDTTDNFQAKSVPVKTEKPQQTQVSSSKKRANQMMTTAALEKEVKDAAWESRRIVNQVFHNALCHFLFLYQINPADGLVRITEILSKINEGKIAEVITELRQAKAFAIQRLSNASDYEVVDPINPLNLGGAATYKEGTVEEALFGVSSLLLDTVIDHASGEYQENILRGLMLNFKEMLEYQSDLIPNDRKRSDDHATTWLKNIFKTWKEGYYQSADEVRNQTPVFFIPHDELPTIAALADAQNNPEKSSEYRARFLTNCRIAIVKDVVASDERLQTKFLESLGLQEKQAPGDLKQLIARLKPVKQGNTLVLPPVGCGAFGHKPPEFWEAFKDNYQQLDNDYGSLVIATRIDRKTGQNNFSELAAIAFWNPIMLDGIAQNPEYDVSEDDIKQLWKSTYARFDSKNPGNWTQRMFAINSVAAARLTPDQRKAFAMEMLQNHAKDFPEKISIIKTLEQLSPSGYYLYRDLMQQATDALRWYDEHIQLKRKTSNKLGGEDRNIQNLRNFTTIMVHKDEDLRVLFDEMRNIIKRKHEAYPTMLNPPSVMDQTFQKLEEQFSKNYRNAVNAGLIISLKRKELKIPETGSLQKEPFLQRQGEESPKAQAKRIFDRYHPAIKSGEKIALLYAANNNQALKFHNAYEKNQLPSPNILQFASNQGAVFRELLILMENAKLNPGDLVIIPIATSMYGTDNIKNNIVTKDILDRDVQRVNNYRKNGYKIYGIPTKADTYALGGGKSTWFYDEKLVSIDGVSQGKYLNMQLECIEKKENLKLPVGTVVPQDFMPSQSTNENPDKRAHRAFALLLKRYKENPHVKIGLLCFTSKNQADNIYKAFNEGNPIPVEKGVDSESSYMAALGHLVNQAVERKQIKRDTMQFIPLSTTPEATFSLFNKEPGPLENFNNNMNFLKKQLANGWQIYGSDNFEQVKNTPFMYKPVQNEKTLGDLMKAQLDDLKRVYPCAKPDEDLGIQPNL